ncbi:MAG: hypothetical protein RR211_05085, partial [Pseudoflavonifractor sp.]
LLQIHEADCHGKHEPTCLGRNRQIEWAAAANCRRKSLVSFHKEPAAIFGVLYKVNGDNRFFVDI